VVLGFDLFEPNDNYVKVYKSKQIFDAKDVQADGVPKQTPHGAG
jgi:hypothetical protein